MRNCFRYKLNTQRNLFEVDQLPMQAIHEYNQLSPLEQPSEEGCFRDICIEQPGQSTV